MIIEPMSSGTLITAISLRDAAIIVCLGNIWLDVDGALTGRAPVMLLNIEYTLLRIWGGSFAGFDIAHLIVNHLLLEALIVASLW